MVKNTTIFLMLIAGVFLRSGDGGSAHREDRPHYNASRCGDCHGRDLPSEAAAYGGLKNFYNSLCLQCHHRVPKVCGFHRDRGPREGGTVDLDLFPLNKGKIDCLTCHDARIQCVAADDPSVKTNPRFLRGHPSGGVARFCFACHRPERFLRFKVHDHVRGKAPEKGEACYYCHVQNGDDRSTGGGMAPPDSVASCRVCHPVGPHPGKVQHLVSLEALPEFSKDRLNGPEGKRGVRYGSLDASALLPLGEGQTIRCDTCHDPHFEETEGRFGLRTGDREMLCRCCHSNVPEEDRASLEKKR